MKIVRLKDIPSTEVSHIKVQDLMERSGVKFGTSGARGLAKEMTDLVCYISRDHCIPTSACLAKA
jgi:hypothetical protein